ncbi:MAG TPA: PH domain-containing protein [Candidatus Saccharimonadia bacterium]|jgi:hypothetical protein|nr:PH domain-containing protein [Candidatus Saccharimonadia bacterium]
MSKKSAPPPPSKTEQQFPGQHSGEEVRLVFRQHPVVMRKALVYGLLVILVAVVPLDFPQVYSVDWLSSLAFKIMIAALVVVFAAWFYRWVGWYYTLYIVTTERILAIQQKGFFNRKVDEWQLDGISNVNYHINGFQAVIFGFGDITARTYIGDLEMHLIHHPAEIHSQIVQAVRAAGGGAGMAGGSTQQMN